MVEMKGIKCCGECVYYYKPKHKCTVCNNVESDPRRKFYDDCPLPQVIKPKRGSWEMGQTFSRCSACGKSYYCEPMFNTVMPEKPWWNFCPNCGADMRGVERE